MIRRPVLILMLLVLCTAPGVAAQRLAGILPVVGSTEGAQGARFRTGLQLSNPSAEVVRGALVFREQGKAASPTDPRVEFELAARATQSFGDVVADMGASGLGSMEILVIEGADPVVVARAYADGEGTLGVTVPLVKVDEALQAGQSATLLVPSDLSRFRFNVGVRSLVEGARLKVEVFEADGSLHSTLEEKVYPADAFVQVPSATFAGDLVANQSLRVEVVAGSAIVYGTTTDNRTNDPSLQIDRLLNKPPVLIDQDFARNQNGSTTVELEFIDPDGDPTSLELAAAPQSGTLTSFERIGEDGWRFRAVYTPAIAKAPSAAPIDQFVIIVRDGQGNFRRLVIEIPGGLNRAPTADDASYSVDEDATLEITLSGSDPDGDPLEFRIVTNPSFGTLGPIVQIDETTARITYTYSFEAGGSDSFEFEVADTVGQTDRGTISIEVRAVNDPPTAAPDSYSVLEDQTLIVPAPGVLANDTDPDSAPLATVLASGPTQGTLALSPDGSFTYTPAPNFFGTDGFSYRASDGAALSAPIAVTITVIPVNDPPVAANDAFSVAEGGVLDTPAPGVLGNDIDIEGTPLSAVLVSGVTSGVLTLNGDGSFTYTHDGSESLSDSFAYAANDGGAGSNVATVTITVTPVNDASVIDLDADDSSGTAGSGFAVTFNENDAATLLQDPLDATIADSDSATLQTLTVTLTNLIDAGAEILDADVTALPILKSYDATTDPAIGVLTLTGPATIAEFVTVLRTVTYRNTSEDPDETARVVTYVASDGIDDSAAATATVSVSAVNDAPVVDPASLSIAEDAVIGASVGTVTFSDPDSGQSHAFAITAGNTGGAFAIDPGTGEITVAVGLDFETLAAYSLTVEVTDDGVSVLSGSATIGITVTDVDEMPVAVDDAATVTEDDPATTIDVLANDTDVDAGPISIQSVTQPASGTVVITGGGAELTYEPAADSCNDGSPLDAFTYTLNGGSTGTVSVTVTCVDDAPTALDDSATVVEDAAATTIDVLANDTDVDGGAISIQSVTQPANGTVVITGGGADLTYAPAADYCNDGSPLDTFTYALNGGSTGTVSLTVTCVDDLPTAIDDSATVSEDAAATTIDVLANDTDVDGGPKTIQSVTQPANGTVVITSGGADLVYAPGANYCNDASPSDTFIYTLNGGSTATVSLTVTCVDDAPVAVGDAATVVEDSGTAAIDVIANDTDIDGGTNTVQSVTQPANGAVVITGGGANVSYTPNANYCNDGSPFDTFTYTLNGGSTAIVSFTVTCVDDPPVAVDDAATVTEDSGVNPIDVLANDPDLDAGPKVITVVQTPSANGGTVVITGGGTGLTYKPAANYCGSLDTFTYTLNGGSIATVSVAVTCVNDASVIDLDADDSSGTAGSGFAVTFNENDAATLLQDPLDATIVDLDSATLQTLTVTLTNLIDAGAEILDADVTALPILKSYDATTDPTVGVLTLTGPATIAEFVTVLRTVTYRNTSEDPDETARIVTFVASDGTDASAAATASVSLSAVNDAPVVAPASLSIAEDAVIGASVGTVTFSDPDSGQSHAFAITAGNTGGAFAIDPGTGEITVTVGLDFETLAAYSLTVEVTDDGVPVLSGSATVGITVTDVDDAPVAVDDAATVTEDDPATTIDVLANDTDVDGGPRTIESVTPPANGTVVITGGGADLTYEPAADYCNDGSPLDTFIYTLNGGSTGTVSVTVTCVDDAPTGVDDSATVSEDAAATTIDVLPNDTDVDGGPISIQSVTQPANGTVVITGAGADLTYQPDADYCNDGSPFDTFTYTLNGGSTATVSLTVTCVDDVPVAVDDAATVVEDSGAATIDVMANDTDIDGGTNIVASVTQPANGAVAITGSGATVSYTPNANYCNGGSPLDTFTYTLNGGSTATVSITVTCVDDPPVAADDAATVTEDSVANAIDILANDTDIDGGPKLITVVQTPTTNGGTVTITGGGTGLVYSPATDYCNDPPASALDTFTYTLNGGSTATVSVTVTCVNDGPSTDLDTDDDKGTGGAGFAVTFTEGDAATLLQDADDPLGAAITDIDSTTLVSLTVTLTNLINAGEELLDADVSAFADISKNYDTTTPGVGVLTISSATPQPIADYVAVLRTVKYRHTGDDPDATARVVQFVANDGATDSNTAVSTVTIVPVDDAPVAVDDAATVTEDSGVNTIDVLASDTDVDGGLKEVQSVTQPANGSVLISVGGTGLTYSPNANYCNDPPGTTPDTFTYSLNGGSTATVSVTVTCVDDAPTAVADAATVVEDSVATSIDVLANDTDTDGGPIIVDSVIQPLNGTVAIAVGGTGLTYAPNANYCNTPPGMMLDTFTYSLAPGGSSTTVTVTVTCVDDDPTAVADAATVVEDSVANAINVLANDTDPDAGPISVGSVTDPANGTVAITGGGTGLTYTPDANYCNAPPGTALETFTYVLAPGGSSTTVTVTVTCVDDPPVAVADAATVGEDSGANTIDVLANDTDIDAGTNTIQSVTQPANGAVAITGSGANLTYTPNLNYCNDGSPLDTFTYTLSPGGSSTTVSMTVMCVNDSPVAGADAFDFIGNTELRVDLAAGTTPHALETTGSGLGVLNNDSDPVEGDSLAITSITVGICTDSTGPSFDCTDPAVGTVSMQSDGTFSFIPAPGDAGASESFTYVVADDGLPSAATATGTVTLTRVERVWYVRPSAAPGGTGTSSSPFNTLTSLNGAAGEGDSDFAGDYIFVHYGTLSLAAPFELEAGQHLVGAGTGLSIPVSLNANGSPTALVAVGAHPLVTNGTGETVIVGNAIPVEIVGLSLQGSTNAIDLTSTAALTGSPTLTIGDNIIRGAGEEGIDVNLNAGTSGTLRLNLTSNKWDAAGTHTGNAIDVSRLAGELRIDLSNNTNILSAATAVTISGGNTTITGFANNTVHSNTGGSGIVITNATFDAVPEGGFDLVSGGTTVVGASGTGVGGSGVVMTSVKGDLQFTNLNIFAANGTGLQVSSDGAANLAGATGMRFRVAGSGNIEAIGSPAVNLSNLTADLHLSTVKSTNTTASGVSLATVSDGSGTNAAFSAGSGSSITTAAGATGAAFNVAGGNARITYAGTITNNSTGARAVSISGWAGDDSTDDLILNGAIDENGLGILVNGNGGSRAITFSGGLDIDTTTGQGFAATNNTNTGGLHITGTNTINSINAAALRVTDTTIGSSHLTFQNVSSSNSTNGIVINTTGSTGSLRITGTGSAGSGGMIQFTAGHAISLTNTLHPELAWLYIQNIGRNGIDGQQVASFTLSNSTINNVGTAAAGQYDESNISFNDNGAFNSTNLSGTVSITNNTLTNARRHGIQIENGSGTIGSLTITGNTLTSSTSAAASLGTAILVMAQGSPTLNAHLTTGTISNNTITRFPSGEGIAVLGGAGNSTNTTSSTLGAAGVPILISSNSISGGTGAQRMGSNAIRTSFNGLNGIANFTITNNGTTGAPITNIQGQGISSFMGGSVVGTSTISGNVIVANQTLLAGTQGLAVQVDDGPAALGNSAADYNYVITNNNVTNYEGSGIRAIARASQGKMDVTIQNNTVGAPIFTNRNGIRIDSGSAVGDVTVCLAISGNTSAGSGLNQGIGIRKQGTVATVNDFGIVGLAPSPTTGANAAAKVAADNPTGNGVDDISGDNFVNCSITP